MIEMAPLEQFLEESGEPHLIIDRAGHIAFATAAAKLLIGVTGTLRRFDADKSLAHLLSEWAAQRECFGYTGAATLRAPNDGSAEMRLMTSTIDYRGTRHLLGQLRPLDHSDPVDADLWSEIAAAARESAFAAAGAMVEHELNQSLAAIVNYVQTSAVLLSERESSGLVREALSEAGQQALRCADMLRALRRNFGFEDRALARYSLNEIVRQAHQLLAGTRTGATTDLVLHCDGPELFVRLNRARFLSMLLLLMQRYRVRAPADGQATIAVAIESRGGDQAIVRFLDCGVWDVEGASGKLSAGLIASDRNDVRLLAICQATMSLHGGHVSITGNPGRNVEVELILGEARTGGGQYG